MNRSGFAALAMASLGTGAIWAADATTPIDYSQRNAPYAVGNATAVVPEKQTPATNSTLQEKRFDSTMVKKKTAPLAGRRAGVELKETREKQVQEKNSRRPEVREQPASGFNHRDAPFSTKNDTNKPPTVAKYQDSLTAASASNMARFPALDRATTAKINRFVFRKNPPDSAGATQGKPVTAAASGTPETAAKPVAR